MQTDLHFVTGFRMITYGFKRILRFRLSAAAEMTTCFVEHVPCCDLLRCGNIVPAMDN